MRVFILRWVILFGGVILLMSGCKDKAMAPCSRGTISLQYDDGIFEKEIRGSAQDQILFVNFTSSCYPTNLVEVKIHLFRTDSFTLGIWNSQDGRAIAGFKFSGGNDSSFAWASFDLRDQKIELKGDFWIGIIYSGRSDPNSNPPEWFPAISSDGSQPDGRSYFVPPGGSPPIRFNREDLAIRAIVETQ